MYTDFKFTLRRIFRNRTGAVINIFGLSIGISIAILLINFYVQQSTFDHFHSKSNRIHKLVSRVAFSEGKMSSFGITLGTAAEDLRESFPQVEDATRFYGPFELEVDLLEKRYNYNEVLFADYSILNLFDIPASQAAFQKPTDAIISQEFAERMSVPNAVGLKIEIDEISYTITSVIDIPSNTMFRFDVLIPLESDPSIVQLEKGGLEFETYVLLNESSNDSQTIQQLKERYDQLTSEKWPDYVSDNTLIPLKEVYLSDWVSNRFGNGNEQLLNIILAISLLVIALALINYINIQVANNHSRSAELKLKKIMGADKAVVIKQGMLESMIVIGFSAIASLLLVDAFDKSPLSSLIGEHAIKLSDWTPLTWVSFVSIILFVGVVAGLIPATKLFNIRSITQQEIREKKLGKLTVSLVVFQFFVSSALLTSILFVNAQMDFIKSQPTGYNSEQVVVIENVSEKHRVDYQLIKSQLLADPKIVSVAGSQNKPGNGASGQFGYRKNQSKDNGISISHIRTINGYAETLDLQFVQGGDFTLLEPKDGSTQFILNESAAKQLFTSGEDPIGEPFIMSGREGRIVGVVEDFHYLSFHHEIMPLAINVEEPYDLTLMVKIRPLQVDGSLKKIASVLGQVDPLYVFDYQFLDEQFNNLYQSELQIQKIITYATFVAFSISIIGLLALSIFVINAKVKEIAVRKVLGGSNAHIFSKLSGRLVTWILIGNLISIPVSYYISKSWVADFVYQLGLEQLIWMVPITSLTTLFVAFAVILRKLYKTINMNPVLFLRYE